MLLFPTSYLLLTCTVASCILNGVNASPVDQSVFTTLSNNDVPKRGKNAAVVCETDICSQVGIALNEAGGNAADMLVGTTFCVGVVAMYHSGIGGGGFALVHLPNGTFKALDFREEAPSGASPEMWEANPLSQLLGGLASGIPGELRGLEYIHSNFGKLPWSTVVAPSVKLARDGFEVNKDLERYMNITVSRVGDFFSTDPVWAEDFAPNGTRVRLGDWIKRPKFGKTLERIAKYGPNVFYEGDLARQIVIANRKHGGIFTEQDLRNYKLRLLDPISTQYGNFTVTSVPSPAGGAGVLSIMKTMEGYDFSAGINLTTHRLNEAFRFAFGNRAALGDPFFDDKANETDKAMVTNEFAASVRDRLNDEHTLDWREYVPSGFETHESRGTSHIVAADSSGLAISFTSTVNFYFGSGVMVPESGVILNDQMADFSTPHPAPPFYRRPAPANFAGPGKRPMSSCSPTMVTLSPTHDKAPNERASVATEDWAQIPILTVGAAGGSRIVTLIATLLLTLLPPYLPHPFQTTSHPPTLKEVLSFPRIHDQLSPNETSIEYGESSLGLVGFDNTTSAFLEGRGHKLTWVEPHYSAAQAISWDCKDNSEDKDCGFTAASDPRHRLSGARVK